MSQLAAQVGAAALAIGLSLAGPQAAGLAAADSGDTSASSAESDSANQPGRSGKPTGNRPSRRGAAPAGAARKDSANKSSAAISAAAVHPVAANNVSRVPSVAPVELRVPAAPWLRVGGAGPSGPAPAPLGSGVLAASAAAVPVQAPPATVASVSTPALARAASSAWSRLVSDLLPAQGLAEGALLLFRRGTGVPTVRTSVPRAAAAVDSNGNQSITLDGSKALEDAMSIRGVLLGLFGGTLNSLSDLTNGGYVHNYVAVNFTAGETKTYVFGQASATQDTVIVVYDGPFNPASPRTNAAVLNDNAASPLPAGIVSAPGGCGGNSSDCPQVSVNLTAGQTVTVLVTTAGADTLANPRPYGLSDAVSLYTNGAGYFWHPNDNFPTGNVTVSEPDANGQDFGAAHVTDPDSDPLTYTASTPGKGSVTVNPDGTFVYTPTAGARHAAAADGASGSALGDSFTITADDGRGGFVTIPVVLTVAPANNAPTATPTTGGPDPATGAVSGTAGVTDGDADPLTYTVSTPANGSVTLGPNGAFTYTPTGAARHAASAGGATSDAFTITVNDGHGGTLTIPVTVSITSSNTAPTGTASTGGPNSATGAVSGAVDVTDADSDPITYTSSTPANGSVTLGPDGAFTYTPTGTARHAAAADDAPASALSDAFTITLSDGHGGTTDVAVVVTIAPANDVPVASATVGSADAAGVVTGTMAATDGDSDALSYKASDPANGVVALGPDGAFTYTPSEAARHEAAADGAAASALSDAFTITVSDGHGGMVDVPVSVGIAAANSVPTGTLRLDDSGSGGTVSGAVLATDADSDALTYTASAPANGSVNVGADGTFKYMPAPHQSSAADAFTITVSDGHGGTIDFPVTVTAAAADPADSGAGTGGGGGQIGAGYSGPAAATVAAAVDVTEAVSVAAAVDMGAVEAAPAAAAAEAEPAAAAAEPAAEASAAEVSATEAEKAGADGSSKDGSDGSDHTSAARGAFHSRPGDPQRPAMTSGKSAGKSAGRSAGKPFSSSSDEESAKASPYSPANPAAALGLVGMLLMAVPMAGVSASAAAAGSKATT